MESSLIERDDVKREARARFLVPMMEHLNHAGLGHVSEIADGELSHTPRGCPIQAWSLGELIRLDRTVLALSESRKVRATSRRRTASKNVSIASAEAVR